MNEQAWEEILAEFRALGGTADNICLKEGQYGRGIFPVDSAKPVTIRIPDNLLLETSDIVFENGSFRTGPSAKIGFREHQFIETYMNRLSWLGGRDEIEEVFDRAQELPEELRNLLKNEHNLGGWFDRPTDNAIEQQFVDSRCVHYRGRIVIMPIIELLNHSPLGQHYEIDRGIALKGIFTGEIMGRYSDTDALGVFTNWGFASEQPQAFSVALKSTYAESTLQIGRNLNSLSPVRQFWIPKLSQIDSGPVLEFLMLGNKKYPRMNKGIFYKLMRDAGRANFEEAFDLIQHANLTRIAKLLAVLEKVEGTMVQTLRQVARYQLQALSFCMGAREF